jgi:hypothetical protein
MSLAAYAAVPAAAADSIQIRGFTIEYAQVGAGRLRQMQPSLERQIEIVEQSGVPAATLDFFRSVPVIVVPNLDSGFGHAGVVDGRQIVELKAARLPQDRPILLHELLHAYHGLKLGPTPMIRDSYQQALRNGFYQQYAKAHFLENPREYFAVIGSIFLYGKRIDQPPFDCSLPVKFQPEFIAFLTGQFGPHSCR